MIEALVTNIRLFLLIFFRIIAMVELAPLLSSSSIPQLAKIGMSFFISAAVFPSVLASASPIPTGAVDYGLLVLGEVGIGLLIGFLLNLIFIAFQLAGRLLLPADGLQRVARVRSAVPGGNPAHGRVPQPRRHARVHHDHRG